MEEIKRSMLLFIQQQNNGLSTRRDALDEFKLRVDI